MPIPYRSPSARSLALLVAFGISAAATATAGAQQKRPMTFMDGQLMRQAGSPTPSPDGKWMLYTVSVPDWKEARRQTDIYLVSLELGVTSTRQLTFTKEKNESSPEWSRDGSFFVFASNRDAANNGTQNQLYVMRPDGGEARRITDARDGVSNFALSRDGKWIAYRSGKAGEEQLYRLAVADLDDPSPEQLTRQSTGVGAQWQWAPDSRRIYFTTADTLDADARIRREKKFTVNIRNDATPLASLWALDVDQRRATRLTSDATITVSGFTISDDGKWVGFRGTSANRYERNITEQGINTDLFLLDVATGSTERLTNNKEVGESGPSFSPDGKWIAFSGPDDLTRYSMSNTRVYVRALADRGGSWRKLGSSFDGDVTVSFWSADSRTIYFNEGVRATNQVLALDVQSGTVRQLTHEKASMSVARDEDSGALLINYADPRTPATWFTATIEQIANRASWRQLTNTNPQVSGFALGEEEEITWKSKDGRMVGGVLIKPVGYQPGVKYPLVVAIHGGPASADVLGFNGGYGSQVYAGAGYAVLRPNYRGSTNYGEAHKTGIVGNYFPPGFDDIMTGVDYLIAQGIVDSTRMGVFGWSAGGHWSNWILTHTNRFKAISSGAGTSNWVSMYAQSDVQRNRQFYLGDKLPYDDFDAYWNQSPIKYIRNARTPTMIHVVEGDPRVPSPQSVELHMALKKLGVPTELFMYPGSSHGIPDARNQLVKSVAEMAWMDYYVRGKGSKFAWRDVLKTLETTASVSQD
jgi:dipeptidyl aminopeptidase/acylaminoacyl peptidase